LGNYPSTAADFEALLLTEKANIAVGTTWEDYAIGLLNAL
jgi:hypothetical protein